ncbi:MAG: RIO1 family regulatory kinase/ATPase [Gemmatimonadota bacterium]
MGTVDLAVGAGRFYPCHFVVSEWIRGERFDLWRGAQDLPTENSFFVWARRLTEAIGEIHRAGIVHGDVWHNNIIVRDDVDPVFIDLGQSIFRASLPPAADEYESHPYMAPERKRSIQADVFSLCATLFFLATGNAPVVKGGDPEDLKRKVVRDLQRDNPILYRENPGVADIIARGLRELPGRTLDAERLLEDIDLFDKEAASSAKDPRNLLRSLGGRLARLETEEPLFTRIVGMRLRQLDLYADEMSQGLHDVRGDHESLVMAFAQYLSVCDINDQYLTVSRPHLWWPVNMGVNGRVQSVNKQIIKRGTIVRRVFALTTDDLRDSRTMDVLRAHAEMLNAIDSEGEQESRIINTRAKDLEHEGVFTGVLLLPEDKLARLLAKNPHAGIWIRDSRVKVIVPFYDENRTITGFRLMPGDGTPLALRTAFLTDYLHECAEIRDFLTVGLNKSHL